MYGTPQDPEYVVNIWRRGSLLSMLAYLGMQEGEAAPVRAEPGVILDEVVLGKFFIGRNAANLRLGKPHLAGPSAAGSATLAFVKNRHWSNYRIPCFRARMDICFGLWRALLTSLRRSAPDGQENPTAR